MKNKGGCLGCNLIGLLAAIGALNWGLVGAFHFNLVETVLLTHPTGQRIVYILIGIAGLIKILSCFMCCPGCKKGSCEKPA